MYSLDTYFLEVSDNAFLKVTIKSSFRGKNTEIYHFLAIFWSKNRGVQPKKLKRLQQIWHYYTVLRYIVSGNRCMHFTESSHQSNFKVRKLFWDFSTASSNTETDECNQQNWKVFNILELLHLAELHIIWKWMHLFPWKQPPLPI